MSTELDTKVAGNTVYYAISRTQERVLFVPHYNRTTAFKCVYRCTPENWDDGNLWAHATSNKS